MGKYAHDQMLNEDRGVLTRLGVSLILVLTFIQVYRVLVKAAVSTPIHP